MDFSLADLLLILYYFTLGLLALYGMHRFVLLALYYRHRREHPATPRPPRNWSVVTVQLPLYNEIYVAERLIEAVSRLDYPRDRLEIQVLDDSTDETFTLVADLVARLRAQGLDIHHLHRANRSGFKAGALAHGLRLARGEFVAVFDADFVPPPHFLKAAVPFFSDTQVGMVQARWGHLNRQYSLLTRTQAILLDGHFLIEHAARCRAGRFFNFNGTAGIWRRRAIEEAGGWQHDTLTEDLDLSYRAQLAGWKFLFLPELQVPAELPVDVHAFKVQQHRWAKGSIQTARKLLLRLLASRMSWAQKLEALVHLSSNFCYLLMLLLSVLIFPAMYIRRGDQTWQLVAIDLPLFLAATLSVILFYTVSQILAGPGWQRRLRLLPAVMALGIGLSVNNARAVLSGMARRVGTFNRTPKYRIEGDVETPITGRYRVAGNLSFLVEGLLAVLFVISSILAVRLEMWLSLPFLYLFLQGYTYISLLSVIPTLGRGAPRLRASPAPLQ